MKRASFALLSLQFFLALNGWSDDSCAKAKLTAPSIANIEKLIKYCKPKDLTALLELLPEEYRGYYTLSYQSHSIQRQSVNYKNPRVVMFGKDGQFMISFTGDTSHPDFNTAEIIEQNPNTREFDFHEIRFGGQGLRVEKNAQSCKVCHGDPPLPIWNSSWRGFYGSHYNMISDDIQQYPEADREKFSHDPALSIEVKEFKKFQSARHSNPRYALLKPILGSASTPYGDRLPLASKFEPNWRLGQLLAGRTGDELFEKKKRSGVNLARMLPYALWKAAQFIGCNVPVLGGVTGGSPSRPHFIASSNEPRFELAAAELRPGDFALDFERTVKFDAGGGGIEIAFASKVLSAASEIDPELKQQLKLIPNVYFDNNADSVLRAVAPQIPQPRRGSCCTPSDPKFCGFLKEKFEKSWAATLSDTQVKNNLGACGLSDGSPKPPQGLQEIVAQIPSKSLINPLIVQCAGCHMNGIAPPLPFDNPQQLPRDILVKIDSRIRSEKADRMPPDASLSPDEKRELLEYFGSLTRK